MDILDIEDKVKAKVELELTDFFDALWDKLQDEFPEAPLGTFKRIVDVVLEEAVDWDGWGG